MTIAKLKLLLRDARIRPGQCGTPAPVSPEFDQSIHHRLPQPIFWKFERH